MKPLAASIIITIACVQLYCLMTNGFSGFADNFGAYNFLGGLLFLFVGLLVALPKQSREVGQGMMIASGIMFLVGLATCSGVG